MILNLGALEPAWRSMRTATPAPVQLRAIRSDAEYDAMVEFMNELLDVVGADEAHLLADLLDLVGELISAYEARHIDVPDAEPREVLRHLIEAGGLKQADLTDELGSQSVVSEVLAGKREVNLRQAKALAERFHVSPAVFV